MNTHSKFFIHDSDRVARGLPLHLQLGSRTTLSSSDYCTAQSTDYSATDYSATNYILFRACEACLGLCCSWPPKDVGLLGKRQVGWRTRLARCMGRFLRHRRGSSSMSRASIDVVSRIPCTWIVCSCAPLTELEGQQPDCLNSLKSQV